ncbi:MAG TPA: amidohydrolase family protein [Candidatus Tectomicrobia bacterium]|jgi:aminocarboxymuconate-semialdehyde decarboxylase
MRIDMHAHYVPPRILAALERAAVPYGVRVQASSDGLSCLHFNYGLTLRPFFPQLLELDERWRVMEAQGIDLQLLSVWTDMSGYGLEPTVAARWHRLLNESLTEVTRQHPQRLAALASVPLQDPARAAEELAYGVRQCGAVGGVIATNIEGKNLDEPALDEFWSAAVELRVPLFLHPVQPVPVPRTDRYYLTAVTHYLYDSTVTIGALLFSGVLDRFPGLQLILPHGGGFYPYQAGRFDIVYTNLEQTRQKIAQPPSAYLRRFYYDTIVHHPTALQFLRTLVGSERLLLGSDYPFPMADPDPVQRCIQAGFSPTEMAAITGDTARALFRLG